MRYAIWLVVPVFGCGTQGEGAPIRANLADGQVLSGELLTSVLVLQTSVGTVQIPLEDVGEVVPTEAAQLGSAAGKVTVWLRNGSEFVGTWADPELAVGIEVGGALVDVDLPMDKLSRLQTRAGEVWTEGTAYRVRTLYGDDFLVDPDLTRLVIENELGTFSPFLSECVSARPVAEATGDWRVELTNGTVLVGPLADDAIAFALPLGPEEITVGLDDFAWMERVWFAERSIEQDDRVGSRGYWGGQSADATAVTPATTVPAQAGEYPPAPRPKLPNEGEWFDNGALRQVKEQQVAH